MAPPLGPGPKEAIAVPFKGLKGARVRERAEQLEEGVSGGVDPTRPQRTAFEKIFC